LSAKGLIGAAGNLREEHDGHPFGGVPHSLPGDQAQVEASRQHKEGNEDGPKRGFEGEAFRKLRLFWIRGFFWLRNRLVADHEATVPGDR
jgi:hypothetical protein